MAFYFYMAWVVFFFMWLQIKRAIRLLRMALFTLDVFPYGRQGFSIEDKHGSCTELMVQLQDSNTVNAHSGHEGPVPQNTVLVSGSVSDPPLASF